LLIQLYRNAIAKSLEDPVLWYKLALSLCSQHDWDAALLAITQALHRNADDARVLQLAVRICLNFSGKTRQAVEYANRMLLLASSQSSAAAATSASGGAGGAPGHHHPHHQHRQSRVSLNSAVSMLDSPIASTAAVPGQQRSTSDASEHPDDEPAGLLVVSPSEALVPNAEHAANDDGGGDSNENAWLFSSLIPVVRPTVTDPKDIPRRRTRHISKLVSRALFVGRSAVGVAPSSMSPAAHRRKGSLNRGDSEQKSVHDQPAHVADQSQSSTSKSSLQLTSELATLEPAPHTAAAQPSSTHVDPATVNTQSNAETGAASVPSEAVDSVVAAATMAVGASESKKQKRDRVAARLKYKQSVSRTMDMSKSSRGASNASDSQQPSESSEHAPKLSNADSVMSIDDLPAIVEGEHLPARIRLACCVCLPDIADACLACHLR